MKISLRAGEQIYVNGAVLRVDRKVSLEIVNDVMFLLEGQVMQASDATTALRQLYFIVQLMLMNPTDIKDAAVLYLQHHAALLAVCENRQMLEGLAAVDELVGAARYYEASAKLDVRHLLHKVTTPTLVMHPRGDANIPVELGRQMAAGIPGARFLPLPGQNHLFLQGEPAEARFFEEVDRFLAAA